MQPVTPSATDVNVTFRVLDSTTFLPYEGLTSASTALALWYQKGAAGAVTAITESDLSAITDAHSDGGIKHIDDGWYRLCLPDAASPTAEHEVTVYGGTATGYVILGGALVGRYGSGAAGAGLSAVPWNAAWDAEVQSEAADALTAYGASTYAGGAVASVTGNVGGNVTGSVGSVVGAVGSVTGAVGSVTGAVGSVTGNVGGSVASVATGGITAGSFAAGAIDAAAIATDAIGSAELAASAITEIQAGLSTLDAAGVRTAVGLASANLDTQLDALPTNAELATALGTADDATLAAIAALNNLSSAQAQTAAEAALTAYGASTAAALATVGTNVSTAVTQTTAASIRTALGLAAANIDTQFGLTATAAKLLSYVKSLARKDVTVDPDIGGAFDDALHSLEAIRDRGDAAWGSSGATGALASGTAQAGSTSTTIKLASAASSVNDLYNYLIVLIDGGTGAGQARMITDYVGSTRVATVDRAWITTPDATSTYRVHHWSDNWAGTVRTLTNAAGDAVDTDADPITRMRGDSWSIEITGIGAIPTWTKAWFTVKCHTGDLDADAWLMIIVSNPGAGADGLQVVYGGGSITAGNASLTVDDASAGDVTVAVAAVETAKLPERATLVYDVQFRLSSGAILTRKGTFAVTGDVTRATS